MNHQMYEIVTLPARRVTGIAVRTSNAAPDCAQKIGDLWQRYLRGGVREALGAPARGVCYGLYTQYARDEMSYLAVVGCESDICPVDCVTVEIPAGRYAKFTMTGQVMGAAVGDLWHQIWGIQLPRAYTVDWEEYVGVDAQGNGQVNLYIALADLCQSCGMPMTRPEDYGTEQDGRKSPEYCRYCRKDGAFVQDCTMEEMIEGCLAYAPEAYGDPDEARRQMRAYFPTLKRWNHG